MTALKLSSEVGEALAAIPQTERSHTATNWGNRGNKTRHLLWKTVHARPITYQVWRLI